MEAHTSGDPSPMNLLGSFTTASAWQNPSDNSAGSSANSSQELSNGGTTVEDLLQQVRQQQHQREELQHQEQKQLEELQQKQQKQLEELKQKQQKQLEELKQKQQKQQKLEQIILWQAPQQRILLMGLLSHYNRCEDARCAVCGPVREAIPRHHEHEIQQAQAQTQRQSILWQAQQRIMLLGLLSHYHRCVDVRCAVCGPVREAILRHHEREIQQAQAQAQEQVQEQAQAQAQRVAVRFDGERLGLHLLQQHNRMVVVQCQGQSKKLDVRVGDVVVAINNTPVTVDTDIGTLIKQVSRPVTVHFERGGLQEQTQEQVQTQEQAQTQQQRLLLLHHASKCSTPAGECRATPHCAAMKQLWAHIANCKDQCCQVPNCVSSRYLLSHYHHCKDARCAVCGPVREAILRHHEREIQQAKAQEQVQVQVQVQEQELVICVSDTEEEQEQGIVICVSDTEEESAAAVDKATANPVRNYNGDRVVPGRVYVCTSTIFQNENGANQKIGLVKVIDVLTPTNNSTNLVRVEAVEDLKDGSEITKRGKTFVINAEYLLTKKKKRMTLGLERRKASRRKRYKPVSFTAEPASSDNRSRKSSFSESRPTKRPRESNSNSSTKTKQSPRTSAARTLTWMGSQ